jgi:formylglycine-generating enzyme required for sulfatase activity/predicted DNA-binding WGR domain protein
MAGKSAKSRRLVFSDGKSNKFWNIDLKGSSYTITFGKIGTAGQSQEKSFGSAEAAGKAFEKLVTEKLKKGYCSAAGDSECDGSAGPKEKKQTAQTRQKASKPKADPTKALSTSDKAKVLKLLRERTPETAQLAFALLASFELKPRDYAAIFTDTVLPDLFKLKRGQTVADMFPFWECLLVETTENKPLHFQICRGLGIKINNLYRLEFDGLTNLSDAAAESLSKHKRYELSLRGLTSLSDCAAAHLAKHKGDALLLDGLKSLSDAAAESLSKYKGYRLSLNGLTSLSDAAAHLAKYKGDELLLDGLKSLSDAAAESLGKRNGWLSLNGLTSLSNAAAESLGKHKGYLYLEGLTRLSDTAVESLAKHEGVRLSGEMKQTLDSFRYVDDEERPVLDNPPGTITNSIGIKLVPIAAGTFMMGSPENEKGRNGDEVQHRVTLTKDFYLGMTQVTQAQYQQIMGENPSYFQSDYLDSDYDHVAGRDSSEFPVEQVSWDDAVKFCKKLSALPEEKAAGRVYRLPTEAEWEYACRAGSTTEFSFGGRSKNLGDYAWYEDNSSKRPHPVALKKPNAWGLYDMHGNVREWCSDRFDDYSKVPVNDPVARKGLARVRRGGDWRDDAASCRSARRTCATPSYSRNGDTGFRVVLNTFAIPKEGEKMTSPADRRRSGMQNEDGK